MKKSIAIIGGGAAALMLAATLDEHKFDLTIYERNKTLGRKFLVAGQGGFNLTHAENIESLIMRYTPKDFLEKQLRNFTNTDLRAWLQNIGIETYVGSSKRVFPIKSIKPIEVLQAILSVLKEKKVSIKTEHLWQAFQKDTLIFKHKAEIISLKPDITIFALGGASWKITGSDGNWLTYFKEKNIATLPFQASNCAVEITWSSAFLSIAEGKPIKNIAIQCNHQRQKGEVLITKFGLEGTAIYALIGKIRENMPNKLILDLKPDVSTEEIENKLCNKGHTSITQHLKNALHLDAIQIALLKESLSKTEFTNPSLLANGIKNIALEIRAIASIDEAISTVGGIALKELDENFQLKKLPNCYCIGEMLNWDAPTGGYLLQACLSMGNYLGKHLNNI